MLTVSPAAFQDHDDWKKLYEGYAAYYQMPMSVQILETVWAWIFDDSKPFYCLLARSAEGHAIGLMHYREMPSPLRGRLVGFLDDLFIEPDCRGQGVVEALYAQLKAEAERKGWPFVRWVTRENNYRGRSVYDKLATKTDWTTYQLNIQE